MVRDPDGKPLTDAMVVLVRPGQTLWLRNKREMIAKMHSMVVTDAEGRYHLEAEEGQFAIVVVHDRFFAHVGREALSRSFDVTAVPWGRIEGAFVKNDHPVVGAEIRIEQYIRANPRGGPLQIIHEHIVRTDPQGKFVFDRVPPGEAVVSLLKREPLDNGGEKRARRFEKTVSVVAGSPMELEVGGRE